MTTILEAHDPSHVSVKRSDLLMALELLTIQPDRTTWSDDEIHEMYSRLEAAAKGGAG